jgi:hypothetical protein
LVTGAHYQFAWFDGLNRYYVADEHKELVEVLSVQPNVHDAFITHQVVSADARVVASNAHAVVADAHANAAEASAVAAEARAVAADARAIDAEAACAVAIEKLAVSEAKVHQLTARVAELETQLHRWQHSWSMRVTAPLRRMHRALLRLFSPPPRVPTPDAAGTTPRSKAFDASRAGAVLRPRP